MITPDQIRAARALKNWSQAELAERARLATPSIANIELGKQKPSIETLEKIQQAFLTNGIEFTSNEGVQKKAGSVLAYRGQEGFNSFMEDVDQTAKNLNDGYFLVCNVDEHKFMRWHNMTLDVHERNILKSNVRYKIIIEKDDTFIPAASYAEYRWASKEQFYSIPLYIYGDKVAIIAFEENDVSIFVIHHPIISKLCSLQFNEMWERTLPLKKNL